MNACLQGRLSSKKIEYCIKAKYTMTLIYLLDGGENILQVLRTSLIFRTCPSQLFIRMSKLISSWLETQK